MSAPEPRRVLIANLTMSAASGTITYTRDLALALLRQGWTPIVYTSVIGAEADALRAATVPVVTDPAQLGAPPDIIQGHHVLETLCAMARFPNVPVVFVCHDSLAWHSMPPRMPRIRSYVAVDRNCRDRMVLEHGIPEGSVRVFTNPVDLQRFRRRGPLPLKPRLALVFSNQANEKTFVEPIRAACAERGITVDVIGLAAGQPVDRPEEVLPRYDLVFGKARCVVEAAAIGTAVIGCDLRGMSGMLTTRHLEELRLLNFGARTLQLPLTRENLLREIDRYDPDDAAAVSDRIRETNGADLIARQFRELYEEVLAEPVQVAAEDDLAAVSAALSKINPHLYAEIEAIRGQNDPLLKLLGARFIGRPLRFAHRLNRRLWTR